MKPQMNKHLKSFLLGLSGCVTTYILEWTSGQSFGIYTPIIATMIPVIINSINKAIQEALAEGKDIRVDQ